MTSDAADLSTDFAAEFPADEAGWRVAAEAALKGRPLEPLLKPKLVDGLAYDAIAARAPARPIAGRPAGLRWTAMTRIDLASPADANAQALEDLNNGASGLSLALASAEGGEGVAAQTLDRLDAALAGVMLDLAPLLLDAAPFEAEAAAALAAGLVDKRGQAPADVSVLFALDLTRDLARVGALALPWEASARRLAGVVSDLLARGYAAPILMMDQRIAHDAGASEAQELAGALAAAVEHVRALGAHGLDAAAVADAMSFCFSADADQFATIAKLRAARLLWSAIRRELGLDDRPVHIHAETSRRMMARNDAQTNMVRTTIAAFSAGVGGADSVTVLPYTQPLGAAHADARRIARNAQSIVLEETNGYRVADPAAGAGAIEGLTDAIAARAWAFFREIEAEGGLHKALVSGFWAARIAETRTARERGVATRKIAVVGVSEFPKADEAAIDLPAAAPAEPAPRGAPAGPFGESGFSGLVAAFAAGASTADVVEVYGFDRQDVAAPLAATRLAEPYERLRAANEAAALRPSAFLALLGPVARHSARAGFIRNLLAAGGIVAIDGPASEAPGEIAEAFKASSARLAVVCGADPDYAEAGAALAAALGQAGATVWLAGRPKEGREALEGAGVARFVAAGDDAIGVLTEATAIASNGGAA